MVKHRLVSRTRKVTVNSYSRFSIKGVRYESKLLCITFNVSSYDKNDCILVGSQVVKIPGRRVRF